MIKTIALDLDNTLLNSDKKISLLNEKVLKQLHRLSKKIVLCTGRPLPAIQHLIKQLELTDLEDYSITFNGGLVQNNTTKKVLAQSTLSKDQIKFLYDDAKNRNYPLDVLGINQVYSLIELGKSDYQEFMGNMMTFRNIPFSELPGNISFGKAVCSSSDSVIKRIRKDFPLNVTSNFHIVPSRKGLLEFIPLNVNKATGIEKLLSHFSQSWDNVMAFGDEENDLELLANAGLSVAMGNAIPKVKKIADFTTLDNDSDGVAVYLKHYFGL
ncbi:Cof-type HAD-IIB family hydrolase [Lactobacillus sp. ESL0791]|uniref:Cof-type HAD-IIB family hydrolase n=1 Tax=Lactobacillus sp. ESL0791 TaxID=2983234 RepID=UPI0023F9D9D8|nr:Cof-type HAD-IIB family hydrolase [Lactobacillus sp. ESL0791]MDF7639555.1 Cof-type HAD-IIB family hydrolase [Lactobacillus sp. ESL0791]